jgi:hypothetical protein
LHSAIANAEYKARNANETVDVDTLYIKHAIVNEGPKLKRFTPAAMGRATQVLKRTSHVEIVVGEREKRVRAARATSKTQTATKPATETTPKRATAKKATKPKASGRKKESK